jgi:hypothetical protein
MLHRLKPFLASEHNVPLAAIVISIDLDHFFSYAASLAASASQM